MYLVLLTTSYYTSVLTPKLTPKAERTTTFKLLHRKV